MQVLGIFSFRYAADVTSRRYMTQLINLCRYLFSRKEKKKPEREKNSVYFCIVITGNQCRLLCSLVRVFREVKPVLELVLLLRLECTRIRVLIRQVAATLRHGDLYLRKATQVVAKSNSMKNIMLIMYRHRRLRR
ncbi:hypothetical protein ALC57_01564 [Trachymyrmex cornetzi]|uniref:Uncharacterized protein n=1 Tax=Trachymyrmex cornetzi TaxID=471704 RepID=A0A195ELW6_9HYME|nr:hypothetical protein ALC57_01564 [Trachymyrmex cornetzi]